MKLASAAIILCFLCNTYAWEKSDLKAKLLAVEDDCLTQTLGLSDASITKIDFSIRMLHGLPITGSLDKFAMCILQKYHILNDDGTVNKAVDKYHLISDNPKKKQIAMKCSGMTGSNIEETAREILECFLHTDISMIHHQRRLDKSRFLAQFAYPYYFYKRRTTVPTPVI